MTLEERFEILWKQYPRRIGKKASFKHYKRDSEIYTDIDKRLQNAINNYITELYTNKTETRYIKHGSTFFNNWEDYEVMNQEQESSKWAKKR